MGSLLKAIVLSQAEGAFSRSASLRFAVAPRYVITLLCVGNERRRQSPHDSKCPRSFQCSFAPLGRTTAKTDLRCAKLVSFGFLWPFSGFHTRLPEAHISALRCAAPLRDVVEGKHRPKAGALEIQSSVVPAAARLCSC